MLGISEFGKRDTHIGAQGSKVGNASDASE